MSISSSEADSLFKQMMQQTWRVTSSDSASIDYGCSYTMYGGPGDGEIPEIPSFLADITARIRKRIQMPVNYIQCHRFGPAHPVHPHRDPEGMIVPMLTLGQARTFRIGGKMPQWAYRMKQEQRKIELHEPEKEILLDHGSLLIFNGGKILHSMFPADKDPNFKPNDFPCRITLLFRYTTRAMREHGTVRNKKSVCEYREVMSAHRRAIQ